MQFQLDSAVPNAIDQEFFESEVMKLLQHLRDSGGAISALAKLKFAQMVIEEAQGQITKSIQVIPPYKKGISEGMSYYFSYRKVIDYSENYLQLKNSEKIETLNIKKKYQEQLNVILNNDIKEIPSRVRLVPQLYFKSIPKAKIINKKESINIQENDSEDETYQCYKCGESVSESDISYVVNNDDGAEEIVCNDCRYAKCPNCDRQIDRDEGCFIDDELFCASCASKIHEMYRIKQDLLD